MHTLTDAKIRSAAPTERTKKLFDGGGLYLELSPKGGKWWRLKYRYEGKEKRISLGTYPSVSLKAAREQAQAARASLLNNIDPSAKRQAEKACVSPGETGNSFEAVMREWHSTIYRPSVSEGQATRTLRRLESDVIPWLGKDQIDLIKAPAILLALRRVEARGAIETAHRELHAIGQVMRYAVATGRAERDVTGDLRGALRPFQTKHMPSITAPQRVGALLRAIDGYEGSFPVRCALQLAPLVFVRPGELRAAAWEEFDLQACIWRIPASRMKGTIAAKSTKDNDHIVPLSKQAMKIITELQPLTGYGCHLFPSNRGRGRVMSDMTLGAALRRLGFSQGEMTAHGFRAMARTLLAEQLGWDESVIEAQLAHRVRDALGRAYNRTTFIAQRAQMMQQWADYLDQLKHPPKLGQISAPPFSS